jgi:hypothetical protein
VVSSWRRSRRGTGNLGVSSHWLSLPHRIVIETEYDDHVNLPFFKYTFVMRPRTEERL